MFQLSSRRKWDVRGKAPEERAVPLRTVLIRMCSSSEIYAVAGVYTTSRLFLTVSMEYLPLYISQVVISNTEALATVPLILFVSSALSSLFHDRFHSCVGQKWTYAAGCLASVTGCALIYFNTERSDNPKNVFIAAAIFGCGNALTMVVSLSLAANLIGSQVECGAFVYSSVTFADKLINGIAVILVQYM
ncbi:hypothetical protein AAG570_008000 [Ranatra chinensis]|uniref:Uncharacterized protein n=1 Tax=Ranatra chinensis TaxID=642074 RepID=A0ABD0XUU9_9HEMI